MEFFEEGFWWPCRIVKKTKKHVYIYRKSWAKAHKDFEEAISVRHSRVHEVLRPHITYDHESNEWSVERCGAPAIPSFRKLTKRKEVGCEEEPLQKRCRLAKLAEEPAAEEPATKELAAEELAVEEPAAEEPADEEISDEEVSDEEPGEEC